MSHPSVPSKRSCWPLALSLALLLSAGCGKVREDQAKTAALRKINAAISEYSAASKKANSAHSQVMAQFQKANQAKTIAAYRDALRQLVVPALDRFIIRLQEMPTMTPELKTIHRGLVDAYIEARRLLTAFADRLQSLEDVKKFAEIRDQLQRKVKAYERSLSAYYQQHQRRLKTVEQPSAPATANASAATPTSAP